MNTNNEKKLTKSESEFKDVTENGGIKIYFSGKDNALRVARKVRPRILREVSELSIGSEEKKNQNIVIEGDNLMSMSTLYQYHGKVDLILTDPPYNTGNKDFRYNDRWNKDPNDEGLGDYVDSNDTSRHTKWMKFMLPRLQMMKKMLRSDGGVIAICIDERELFRLGPMLNEIFGEENRLGIISWQKTFALKNDSKHLSNSTEYVLVYAKNEEKTKTGRLLRSKEQTEVYKNSDSDPKGPWKLNPATAKTPVPSMVYGIQHPFTGKIVYPPSASGWRTGKSEFKRMLEEWGSEYEERDLKDDNPPALLIKRAKIPQENDNPLTDPIVIKSKTKAEARLKQNPLPKLLFGKDGKGKPTIKRYFSDIQQGIIATTFWQDEDYKTPLEVGSIQWEHYQSGHNQGALSEVVNRVGREIQLLDGIKPLKLFTKIIHLWCPPNGLVLDPFAGSGTTGEAVLELNNLNKELESRERRFILIEQGRPENGDNYCRTLLQKRLKAVITGEWSDGKPHEPLEGGFRFFELTKQVDSPTILRMEKQELTEAILSSNLNYTPFFNNIYLIAKNKQNEGIYLIWSGNSKKRESNLTENIYYQCALESKEHKLEPIYHVYARTANYQTPNIFFHKIPDKVLIDFGVDPSTDTFINEEE
ncbi:MAG: site-specific DNA-methyltransferase [Candidatus Moeniiplasma glomeromycotorum]|nr:site-specific DNA-methyltransferase [Candidatus Moeniiplasma glomeromycotorum]MCE8169395.1 site-specific DNA-methyltransferase [Candidatus Moeniiplasma glomeromycotorum]